MHISRNKKIKNKNKKKRLPVSPLDSSQLIYVWVTFDLKYWNHKDYNNECNQQNYYKYTLNNVEGLIESLGGQIIANISVYFIAKDDCFNFADTLFLLFQ